MKHVIRVSLGVSASLLPWRYKRVVYRRALLYDIDDTAYVGFSILLSKYLSLGKHARIGHLNVISGYDSVVMQESSRVGSFNWISAASLDADEAFGACNESGRVLLVHRKAAVTDGNVIKLRGDGRDWLCCIRERHG